MATSEADGTDSFATNGTSISFIFSMALVQEVAISGAKAVLLKTFTNYSNHYRIDVTGIIYFIQNDIHISLELPLTMHIAALKKNQ